MDTASGIRHDRSYSHSRDISNRLGDVMYGAIDGELILELAAGYGIHTQLPLFKTPPMYTINEEHLSSCMVSYSCLNSDGTTFGSTSSVDHPSFTHLRDLLDEDGFIDTIDRYSNGDTVAKVFYLNGHRFEVGDRFVCASAMAIHLKYKGSIDE